MPQGLWEDTTFLVGVVSAVVALLTTVLASPLRYLVDRLAVRHRLRTEYEFEQRKKLRELIGKYHGRLLHAAERLNHRFWNLYQNEAMGWMHVGGQYGDLRESYYFSTSVYRFLAVCTLANRFEAEAMFIDSRIAEKTDMDFVKYAKALSWAVCSTELFKGMGYDASFATDHVFADRLRMICDASWQDDDVISLDVFYSVVEGDELFQDLLRLFDGLRSGEQRPRWDRMVVFHFLLMAFINIFGYPVQRSSSAHFGQAISRVRDKKTLQNLRRWLPKLAIRLPREAQAITRECG